MKKYILTIDQGTTSTRAILFDKNSNIISHASRDVKCFYPQPGYVESDADDIAVSVFEVVGEIIIRTGISFDEIDSIGITNQRETTVIWDKSSGKPVYNAIIWQSRQSLAICEQFDAYKDMIFKKTGLLINPYFSASKIRYILDHIDNGQQRAENGELLFGTIDTWIIYCLTKGKKHLTDTTNASRTMLFNIKTLEWDNELLKLFNIPKKMLPKVLNSSDDFGIASTLNNKVHIYGVAGDQQASLFGHNCFSKGQSKNTYGTGCFMLLNTGDKCYFSKKGLLTTIAWTIDNKTTYALEGSVFIGGAAVQWLRDGLKFFENASDSETLASHVDDTNGVYVVPSFVGLGTPYWDSDAKGAIFGITRGTTSEHITRATLEGIAYQVKDVFDVMNKETKVDIKSLHVDGGASANNILMQFQSDILQINVEKPSCIEVTALGVGYLAGLKSGFYKSLDEISKYHEIKTIYTPKMNKEEAYKKVDGWKKAIKATRLFKN